MEHDDESSQATNTSLSLSKNKEEGYLSENENGLPSLINILFPEEFNESNLANDLVSELFCENQTKSSYFTEKNSCSSRISECDSQTLEMNFSVKNILADKSEQFQTRLSFSNVEIGDDCFFPSDVAKEMLQKDEICARELMSQIATDISWSICTRKSFVDTSLLDENGLSTQRRYSVGEYIRKLSGPLSSSSGDKPSEVYFGCSASTPKFDSCISIKFPEVSSFQDKDRTSACDHLYGDISNLPIQDQNKYMTPLKDRSFFQMFLYSVKKKPVTPVDYKYYYIGTENYKNIKRLEAEERKLLTSNFSYNSTETSFGSSHQSYSTVINTNETTAIVQGEDSITEKWIVRPHELTLDVNSSKGCRLLLISYSKRNLKFNTKFDSKFTNVCPISGILPAKSEIGLRILVSRYIKKNFEDDTKDTVIITCGKTEKAIPVKICRQQKSKSTSLKERSYICF